MERDHWAELMVDAIITLKCMLNESVLNALTRLIWLKIRSSGGFCESGNEFSGSIKRRAFLD
jgi:hypothetical protein